MDTKPLKKDSMAVGDKLSELSHDVILALPVGSVIRDPSTGHHARLAGPWWNPRLGADTGEEPLSNLLSRSRGWILDSIGPKFIPVEAGPHPLVGRKLYTLSDVEWGSIPEGTKTYDPECLNWLGTNDFNAADEAYINGNCETLPVVSAGRKTGTTQEVCVGGVVTWTPGDKIVNDKKGGLVKLLSTKQNSGQMPMALVGIKAWDAAHPKVVQGMLSAAFAGGDQIKTDPRALLVAGGISAAIYQENDAAYWAKYYKGAEELDATGQLMVPIGGSRAWNLADAASFFGLTTGSPNAFAATYNAFGKEDVKQYPDRLPTFLPAEKVLNLTYLRAVLAEESATAGKADVPDFASAPVADVTVARRNWSITFRTNSDEVLPSSEATLAELEDALVIAGGTRVEIHGHTDNVGNPELNFDLSKRRAAAVQAWLTSRAANAFPADRVSVFGHGSDQPLASNATAAGKGLNRRVEIVLKEK